MSSVSRAPSNPEHKSSASHSRSSQRSRITMQYPSKEPSFIERMPSRAPSEISRRGAPAPSTISRSKSPPHHSQSFNPEEANWDKIREYERTEDGRTVYSAQYDKPPSIPPIPVKGHKYHPNMYDSKGNLKRQIMPDGSEIRLITPREVQRSEAKAIVPYVPPVQEPVVVEQRIRVGGKIYTSIMKVENV